MEGSIIRSVDRVRITVQLIDAKSDEHLWARSYDDNARDVLALQSRVAATISAAVRGAIGAHAARDHLTRKVDPEADEADLLERTP